MIRFPGMVLIEQALWRDRTRWTEGHSWYDYRDYKYVEHNVDFSEVWIAPWWIAWLYRLLPNHINVNLKKWKTDSSYYLANIAAPAWCVGIRMGTNQRRIPALVVTVGITPTYLPWGNYLYAKMLSQSWYLWRQGIR